MGITYGMDKYGLADKEYASQNVEDLDKYNENEEVRDEIVDPEDEQYTEKLRQEKLKLEREMAEMAKAAKQKAS